jgi:hypothetical protein
MHLLVIFQVLGATSMKMAVFWDVAPCSFVDIDQATWHIITKDSQLYASFVCMF